MDSGLRFNGHFDRDFDKCFVTDTNLYLLDPSALEAFSDNNGNRHVNVIPQVVINELDRKKDDKNEEIRTNARTTLRQIMEHSSDGFVGDGMIQVDKNYFLKIERNIDQKVEERYRDVLGNDPDDQILKIALSLKNGGESNLELVTNDTGMLIKAMGLGFEKGEFGKWRGIRPVQRSEDIYKGWQIIQSNDPKLASSFHRNNYLKAGFLEKLLGRDPYPNEYFCIDKSVLVRYEHKQGRLVPIYDPDNKKPFNGITSKNLQQKFAIDALMNPDIVQVNLIGPAGSGKTMLATTTGLYNTMEDHSPYDKLIAIRPLIASGRELGYFKGQKEDKIMPWVGPFTDNIEMSMEEKRKKKRGNNGRHNEEKDISYGQVEHLMERELVEFEAMGYIKGRTFKNKWVVIDEAEDMTPNQGELACGRIGEDSKIVFTGDLGQIHNKVLDDLTNGLVVASETMKESPYSATIGLPKIERSGYAEDAIGRFNERKSKYRR
ncbi:MAG: PhoH family protein [Candidatus Woesearchaeota archaeon]